jgi:hypothetical protein
LLTHFPCGWAEEVHRQHERLTIACHALSASATLVLDLRTRERVLATDGARCGRRVTEALARRIAADRDDFDVARGLAAETSPFRFDADDAGSWTSMQMLAGVTLATWALPARFGGSPALTARVNAAIRRSGDAHS